ncbi:hypothetical protein GCM10011344_38230 [Dokdonia pacifica]|uniref:Uncharacterized protein n=1 Tax=Dokdonia pacifica TaxID=1627892 RepID=A0A239B6N3_9FLAO|nr:hypothetical protein [Dokdonia pacifica]GGG33768.1 hypothetical protein GCM10011344_38230 [Dokdonia pacifica]SNS03342.1 hypothetical protein SAMN06265376_105372 [Dokdonia pacifica]
MGKKLFIAAFAMLFIMSCSTDNEDNQTVTIDESIPEISNLITHVAATAFDNSARGKYVGVFGHYQNSELHGKIYINNGMDTRHSAIIELINGETLKFQGIPQSRSNPNLIYFEGKAGSFDLNFEDYANPQASNVFMNDVDTEGYITLVKSTRGADPLVFIGTYEETGNEIEFFGNWDLIANPATATSTPFSTTVPGVPFPISGTAVSQEIVTMSISHAGSTDPFVINGADDFDINAAVACAPAGIAIPTTEPVILDITIPPPFPGFPTTLVDAISAGGQTSMINGIEATWSFNYTSAIPIAGIAESYINNDCTAAVSGTWSWNGRTGTTTAVIE